MSLYELPEIKLPDFLKKRIILVFISVILVSSLFGFLGGTLSGGFFYVEIRDYLSKLNIRIPELPASTNTITQEYLPQTTQEEAIIKVVKDYSPAVVSIVITKDVPTFETYYIEGQDPFGQQFLVPQYRQNGTKKQEIGGGTGFIISEDGMVLTNKHVVIDEQADYTVFTNAGKSYPAKVLARDPIQDLAILKINQDKTINSQGVAELNPFPTVKLGNSDNLQIGQTVVAIGNTLGEFRNTVSSGVVSGLSRQITASGGGDFVETLDDVIQTDAAINPGNSGGPLLNLRGEVIGVNTAMVQQAQSVGFALPINKAKSAIAQVRRSGTIVYPFLGIRYVIISDKIQSDNKLPVNYGAWVTKGQNGEAAVYPGSPAAKAGIKEGDIVLKFNGEKISADNTLTNIIMRYNIGDNVILKILRQGKEMDIQVVLEKRNI